MSNLEAKFRSSSLPLLSAIKIELRIEKEESGERAREGKGEKGREGGKEGKREQDELLKFLQETRCLTITPQSMVHRPLVSDLLGRSLSTITPAHRF